MGNVANFNFTAAAPVFSTTTVLPGTAVNVVGGSRLEGTFYEGNGVVTSVSPLALTVELFDTFTHEFHPVSITLEEFIAGTVDLQVLTIEDGTGSEETGATPTDRIPPADITAVNVVATHNSATITYTLPADLDFSHMMFYRENVLIAGNVVGTTYTDAGPLTELSTYMYKVRSVDTIGNVSEGFEFSVVTVAAPDVTPTGPVTNLLATSIGETTAELTFTAPSDVDFSHVKILNGATVVDENVTDNFFGLTGLLAATEYTFTVIAVDTSLNESTPVSVTFTTLPTA